MNTENLFSERINNLPPYVFVEIDKIRTQELKKGRKIISLSIGDPDMPAPDFVIDRLIRAVKKESTHKYPSYWGMIEFRKAVADWYENRFSVKLNPESEVLTLIGSKEGLAHIPLAFINPGDSALIPDPSYPVYGIGTMFAMGNCLKFSLKEENGFLPDFKELEFLVTTAAAKGSNTKLLFLNYPNNPTAGTATVAFFSEIVAFAKKHNIIVCHDNAYSEVYYDGKKQPSFLQAPGAIDVGCEFHSLSKTFNMAGWRVGFVVGNSKVIHALAQIKTNIDSGVFNACQEAGIEALERYDEFAETLRIKYQERRDLLVPAIQQAGLACSPPAATFYIWAKIPKQKTSEEVVLELIRKKGIVALPGSGFGSHGEGFVRFALCSELKVLKQVAELLKGSV